MPDYRQRIYQHYLESGATTPAAEKLTEFRVRAPYIKKLIREHFPADRETAILDLGCGAGPWSTLPASRGSATSSASTSLCSRCGGQSPGLTGVREGDLLATLKSLDNASQGLVLAFDVLEHFRKTKPWNFWSRSTGSWSRAARLSSTSPMVLRRWGTGGLW